MFRTTLPRYLVTWLYHHKTCQVSAKVIIADTGAFNGVARPDCLLNERLCLRVGLSGGLNRPRKSVFIRMALQAQLFFVFHASAIIAWL